MEIAELGVEVRGALEKLTTAIAEVLARGKGLPHRSAISHGHVPEGQGPDGVFEGSLVGPAMPPFDDKPGELMKLHREVHRAAGRDVLRTVIVRATRPDATADWAIATVVVSAGEHRALEVKRGEIDREVEARLREMVTPDAEYVAFSRIRLDKPAGLTRKRMDQPLDRLEVTPEWAGPLARADAIYREAGLELVAMAWTIRDGKLETRVHYR